MNRQHHISLREEFDEHDGDGTRYIVLLDDEYPVATSRFYEIDADTATIGRVVVLPEYRGQKLGAMAVREAEKWIAECGYKQIVIDSRIEAVGFYEKLGYNSSGEKNAPIRCLRMHPDDEIVITPYLYAFPTHSASFPSLASS
ncbi:GNAT family N-acetyltransferase, partial [uncultured Fibrobacter sp.]|uniref:GNAT family N-acetyltransferase n=1 Tax=uncultured Fibrobacter sp. TaxID=261512 RepID=UPI002600A8A6